MRGAFFRIYPGFCYNFSTADAQIWIFLNTFKFKGMLLSLSFGSLLSRGSKDVSIGFLDQFGQELWLIKSLPATSGRRGP